MMNQSSDFNEPSPPPPPNPYLRIPLYQSFFTYILLVIIAGLWLWMTMAGGSTSGEVLVRFGANYGPLILDGQNWRLFTSMFLHIGLTHLLFNAYALFVFGVEMERLYGPARFIVIYLLSGMFGNLLSFAVRGPNILSAGASGAIFGVIGMNLAYFMLHRESLGQMGRQRMMNTLLVIGINLVFGFTVPGIDNLAHLGGLLAGFALGYALSPRYQVVDQYTTSPRLVDSTSLLNRWWAPLGGVIVLAVGIPLVVAFWS